LRDLVLIPAFARPEYTWLCLEHLAKHGARDKEVWVAQDRHSRDNTLTIDRVKETEKVASSFAGEFEAFKFIQRQPHGFIGNAYNFLELYREAVLTEARYV